ncbi:MAG: aminomethyl transferase family protein [Acidobacteria bacterium]|nr:aminomethyl transferase family protein [Acidobacteriota bacterium]
MSNSAVLDWLEFAASELIDLQGCRIPASFTSIEDEYWALKEAAGLMDLSHRGKLLVCGKDAPRFLHGMVTNEVKELQPGQGNHAFFLDVHGHIQADARILRLDADSFQIDCDRSRVDTVRQTLEKYIIADDVEVADQTAALACLAIEGPCSLEVLREAIGFEPPHMLPLEHLEVPDLNLRVARASISGEFGYWMWGSAAQLAEAWTKGAKAGAALGARPVGHFASEICRIEAGLPRFGAEINDKTLPQETGQLHALSYTKGCYLGQEIVERIRTRGHVNRKLVGLLFEGPQDVAPGANLTAAGQSVGSITSAAYSYGLRRTIALAMVRRESSEPGTFLVAGSAGATGLEAQVASLPFFYPMARNRAV